MTRIGTHFAALAALVPSLLGLTAGPSLSQATDTRAAPLTAKNLNPLSTLDPASLDAFRGRPLFASSRRPSPPQAPIVVPQSLVAVASPAPDLRLVGVVAGLDRTIAILRRPAGGPSLNLKAGDIVEGWRIDAITPESVTLRDGEREKVYRLFVVGSPTEPPPAARLPSIPQLGIRSP